MADKLITVKEVAEILGIHEREIWNLVERDKIPYYLVGGRFLRFKTHEVLKLKGSAASRVGSESESSSPAEKIGDFLYFYDN